jgi:hypothetical protein
MVEGLEARQLLSGPTVNLGADFQAKYNLTLNGVNHGTYFAGDFDAVTITPAGSSTALNLPFTYCVDIPTDVTLSTNYNAVVNSTNFAPPSGGYNQDPRNTGVGAVNTNAITWLMAHEGKQLNLTQQPDYVSGMALQVAIWEVEYNSPATGVGWTNTLNPAGYNYTGKSPNTTPLLTGDHFTLNTISPNSFYLNSNSKIQAALQAAFQSAFTADYAADIDAVNAAYTAGSLATITPGVMFINPFSMTTHPVEQQTVISYSSPTLSTTPSGTPVSPNVSTASLGDTLSDTADLEHGLGNAETGTITFTLIAPDSTVVYTDVVPVGGDGKYSSGTTVATMAGTYHWNVKYSGDTYNATVTDNLEQTIVPMAGPAIVSASTARITNLTDPTATSPAVTNVTLGPDISVNIRDTAILSDVFNPTGTVTFKLYYNNTLVDTETVVANGGLTYSTPTGYTLPTKGTVTGTYQWDAFYSGDANNNPISETDNSSEQTIVFPASPSISTVAGGEIVVGSGAKLSDTADLEGAYYPNGGTITFTLTAPDNTVVYTDNVTITAGNGNYDTSMGDNPGGYLPTAVGTYTWLATYNGDGNNLTAKDDGQHESETVDKASPTISTQASETGLGVVGTDTTSDSATISGGYNVSGGSIQFSITAPDGSTTNVGAPVAVSADGTYNSPTVAITEVGTYTWHASYTGDDLNNGAIDNGDGESVTSKKASPSISTSASETNSGVVGTDTTSDTATISGGYNVSGGSIQFSITAPDGSTTNVGAPVAVSADGTYNSPTVTITEVGTYTWHASYTGDGLNNGAIDNGNGESVTSIKASPSIVTQESGDGGVVGTVIPQDKATVSGGYLPTGTVTFTLKAPDNSTVDTETVALVGGVATTSNVNVATQVGKYTWHATYNGNTLDNTAIDNGTNESLTTIKASPTVVTTASSSSTSIGTTAPTITDTAVVAGGYSDAGSLTFTLTGPGGFSYVKTVAVNGNGTYTASTNTETQAGTYTWAVTYTGDSNNNSAVDQGGAAEQVTLTASQPTLGSGQAATIGFWANKNGQALIKTYTATGANSLGTWLSTNFNNLFGNLSGANGTTVAAYFVKAKAAASGTIWNTYAQVLAVALGDYVTTTGLGWNTSSTGPTKYGFNQGTGGVGLGNTYYNVGNNGAAFGVANNSLVKISTLLSTFNSQCVRVGGTTTTLPTSLTFYGNNDPTKLGDANNVFNGINSTGDIN